MLHDMEAAPASPSATDTGAPSALSPPAAPLRVGMSVLGPSGLYLSSVGGSGSGGVSQVGWVHRLSLMFPTRATRVAAVSVALLALAALLTWSVLTIQTKWLDPQSNPPTTVSLAAVQSLPAAHGTLSFFHTRSHTTSQRAAQTKTQARASADTD